MEITKAEIIALLDRFNRQRPGLEFGNYGDVASYRAELRGIARDKREADKLLCAVVRSGMPVETLLDGFRAFSGRLSLETDSKGRPCLEYCTGQYFPVEYRKAVAAVCAEALWNYHREDFVTAGTVEIGTALRRAFRKRFGAGLAGRWFK